MIIDDICRYYLLPDVYTLSSNIFSNKSHKRVVIVEKNGKKKRVVYVPSSIVKMCQEYLLTHYLINLEYSQDAMAYTKGKSIVDNAQKHMSNTYFLHVDIKHYFDSMNWTYFKKVITNNFSNSKFSDLINNEIEEKNVRGILTYRRLFRQGSVTSPYVSNLYLFEFDKAVANYVKTLPNGVYTRYSDDIYISSSSYIKVDVFKYIEKLLNNIGLKVNYSKLKFSRLNDSIKVTGLSLTKNRTVTLNTNYKKQLKHEIYQTIKNNGSNTNFNKLFGSIYYLMMVDIDYFNYLQTKYSYDKDLMMTRLTKIEEKLE